MSLITTAIRILRRCGIHTEKQTDLTEPKAH